MADPLQVVQSLDRLADRYTVFEPDQVLTHGQLNGITDYLDDQQRLSRVCLAGVGLVAGLQVAAEGSSLRVGRGLGVTTDGDLLTLAGDTLFDRWRPYDRGQPFYAPLWTGDAPPQPIDAAVLVPAGDSDVLARPLAELPGGSAGRVVLMLMESVVHDPDLCSGTDCDNLGRDARHRVRLLLLHPTDAQRLLDAIGLAPASERARALPALAMRRPVLGKDVGSTGALAARYRASADATLDSLLHALPLLAQHGSDVLQEMFGSDPTGEWQARLQALSAGFANTGTGLQVWWSFVKDLVDQWNGLRDALLADDSVLLPAVGAFPKHLLLGTVGAPRARRMGLYPSPLDAVSRQSRAESRFAVWTFNALLRAFALPTDTTLRVTPSRGDHAPLAARAIPWHYQVLEPDAQAPAAAPPIQVAWNYALSARQQEGQNLGYRSGQWASTERARTPLAFAINGHDFFRIEGHLGRPVDAVGRELRDLVAQHNLPLRVQEVLLHGDRRLIKRRPPIRYTPLHTLHYLMRQDVALRLDEGSSIAGRYAADVAEGVRSRTVPATTDSGAQTAGIARGAQDAMGRVQASAGPVLAPVTYSAYKTEAAKNADWKASYSAGLDTLSTTKVQLGHLSRLDHASPIDALIISNQPHWIDWLDDLIQAQDDRADDKLLFTQFVQDHPALDHAGGTWRGGTFVLVYDDSGRVVADFALPYPAAEDETPEPAEPPLKRPPYRPPVVVDGGIRVTRPIPLLVDDSVIKQRDVFRLDLEKTTAGIEGLVKGAFVPSNAVDPKKPGLPGLATGNAWVDYQAGLARTQTERIRELQQLITTPGLPDEVRSAAQGDLVKSQNDLAATIGTAADAVVKAQVDLGSSAGAALAQQLTGSASMIQDSGARAVLGRGLDSVKTSAGSAPAALVSGLKLLVRQG